MANQQRPALGQKVIVKALAQKGREYGEQHFPSEWVYDEMPPFETGEYTAITTETSWYTQNLKPTDGIYIGWRTWTIGKSVDHEYTITETREVWLIVTNERRNPVAVFPEHCEVIE